MKSTCEVCQDKGPHWFLATVSYGEWVIVSGPFHSSKSAVNTRGEQKMFVLDELYRDTGF